LICALRNKNGDAALVLIEKGADLLAKDAVRFHPNGRRVCVYGACVLAVPFSRPPSVPFSPGWRHADGVGKT